MSSRVEHKQTRVDENGRLTIPAEYRDELGLVPGASVTLVRVGDTLLMIPENAELAGAFDRVADFFRVAGLRQEEVLAELARIRQDEFTRRFPHLAEGGGG